MSTEDSEPHDLIREGKGSVPPEYASWLAGLKTQIVAARSRAALAVNRELVSLYHKIGTEILERQAREGWGARIVDRLALDLRSEFPDIRGFSRTNLTYMRVFAEKCPRMQIGQQPADQLPWFHIVALISQIDGEDERGWYAAQVLEHGWSRSALVAHIKRRLHTRQGGAVTNFDARLPGPHARLATEALKDPYLFDFLGLSDDAQEREIENALVRHITRFLMELGAGFSFVGRQIRLDVAGDEFFLDLLFYHTRLRCFVVVELKGTEFKPEHAGKLNFYMAAVDAQMKAPDDKPTIGLLLCKTKNRLVAEYALSGISKPIGVAEYQLVRSLPEPLESNLPSIAAIEAALGAA